MAQDAGGCAGTVGTIDPGGIPVFTGDLDAVETAAGSFVRAGSTARRTGAGVHGAFQGLSGCYHAPESWQLLASTVPVRQRSAAFGGDLDAVGRALYGYVFDLRPVAQRLDELWTEASWFSASMSGLGEKWDDHPDNVARNNRLIREVDAAVVQKEAIERRCANAIDALYGGVQWRAYDAGGTRTDGYGFTAIPADVRAPWGVPVGVDRPWYAALWHWWAGYVSGTSPWEMQWHCLQGIGNVFTGTMTGVATLLGITMLGPCVRMSVGRGSQADVVRAAQQTGRAWETFGLLAADAAVHVAMFGTPYTSPLPTSWQRTLDATAVDAAKSLVAWDDWRADPARAYGESLFNLGTLLAPVKGGAALHAGSVAERGAETASLTARAAEEARLAAETRAAADPGASYATLLDEERLARGLPPVREPVPHPYPDHRPAPPVDLHRVDTYDRALRDLTPEADHPTHLPDDAAPAGHESEVPDQNASPVDPATWPDSRLAYDPGDPGSAPLTRYIAHEVGLDGVNPRYSGNLLKVNKPDVHADRLAAHFGGESRVKFENDPLQREIDAVDDDWFREGKPSGKSLGSEFRDQAKAIFTAARDTNRSVYYHFEPGPPRPQVVKRLLQYSDDFGVPLVIDYGQIP